MTAFIIANLAPIMFATLVVVLLLGYPAAFSLGAVGLFFAILMTAGGGAWDNAKKLIEDGAHGGKGSFAHEASITGDTVGDPFKDTSGPALNILLKQISLTALVLGTPILSETFYLPFELDNMYYLSLSLQPKFAVFSGN